MSAREKAAQCAAMLLEGKVSADHFIEEYGASDDPDVKRLVALIERHAVGTDRFAAAVPIDEVFRKDLERAIEKIRGR